MARYKDDVETAASNRIARVRKLSGMTYALDFMNRTCSWFLDEGRLAITLRSPLPVDRAGHTASAVHGQLRILRATPPEDPHIQAPRVAEKTTLYRGGGAVGSLHRLPIAVQ